MLDAHPRDRRLPTLGAVGRRAGRRTRTLPCSPSSRELNRAYEEKFGFRFVVFVNRRPKREIVPVLRERIERSREEELATALDELVVDRGGSMAAGMTRPELLAIDSYWWDWGNLLFRWLHVIAGIAWIGASFYFIALDNHLLPPEDPRDAEKGVGGEAWEVHGGGFYHVLKYRVAPRTLPVAAALVQVGGVHDLALRLRAPDRRLLRPRLHVARRPVRGGSDEPGGDRHLGRRARARVARLRRALPRARPRPSGCSRSRSPRSSPSRRGRRASSSRRARPTSRSAR